MKSFLRFAFVLILLTRGAVAQTPDRDEFLKFHKKMIHIPLPKKGCFKATYPKQEWVEDVCVTTRPELFVVGPDAKAPGYRLAEVTSGRIFESIGSFDRVDLSSGSADMSSTTYSLQLNTQQFDTPACLGAKNPSKCKGWQQFVYMPHWRGTIQYWLLDYESPCPTGWRPFRSHCSRFSTLSIAHGDEPLRDLRHFSLGGKVECGGMDVLTLGTASRNEVKAMSEDSILNLACAWQGAEFGVFGEANGSTVEFNPGTTLAARVTVHNGTTSPPVCKAQDSLTGEKNDLEPVGPCCSYGGKDPAIVFRLSNGPPK
ncbi:MAG TPA: hypothetical protein VI670_08350 [Thermoanaerobaculia bacterium]